MMMLYTTSIVQHMEMMRRVDGRREPSFLLFVLNQIFSINLQKGIEFFPISSPAMDELTNWCFQINTFRIFYSNQVHATASSHFQNKRKFKKKKGWKRNNVPPTIGSNNNNTHKRDKKKMVRHTIPRPT